MWCHVLFRWCSAPVDLFTVTHSLRWSRKGFVLLQKETTLIPVSMYWCCFLWNKLYFHYSAERHATFGLEFILLLKKNLFTLFSLSIRALSRNETGKSLCTRVCLWTRMEFQSKQFSISTDPVHLKVRFQSRERCRGLVFTTLSWDCGSMWLSLPGKDWEKHRKRIMVRGVTKTKCKIETNHKWNMEVNTS